jgi:hypothetical protein
MPKKFYDVDPWILVSYLSLPRFESRTPEIAKSIGLEPKSCLGQVFSFKLACFYYVHNSRATQARPHLELKTKPWTNFS